MGRNNLVFLPTECGGLRQADVAQYTTTILTSNVIQALWPEVHGGDYGVDDCSGLCRKRHVPQMDAVEGSFPDAENQRSLLFQCDVRGAIDESRCHTVRNGRKRSHRAGQYDHAIRRMTTAGNRCGDVVVAEHGEFAGRRTIKERLQQRGTATSKAQFFCNHSQRMIRRDEVNSFYAIVSVEKSKQVRSKECAAGTCHGNCQACAREVVILREWTHAFDYRRMLKTFTGTSGSGLRY